jgi:hypothetical protein
VPERAGRYTIAKPLMCGRMRSPSIKHADRFDLLLLLIFTVLSLWVLALALWQVLVDGRIWTGSETVFFADGFQSLMWVEGIAHHGASPDLYVLAPTPADFFQPLVAISAALSVLGLAPYLALLLWKPVALGGAFFAIRAYVRRTVTGLWPRRVAFALALFFGWGAVIGDSWLVFWSWGYPFALIGLACALGALILYARDRARGRPSRQVLALAALASWLHPWQGETLILVLAGCELCLLLCKERMRFLTLALTVAAAAAPLLYYALLVSFDAVWQREHEVALSSYPLSHVLAVLAPLGIPALLAYRKRPTSFLALSARVWLPVAFIMFELSEWKGSGPTHALLGVTVPLGVLSVEGVRSLPWQRARERLPASRTLVAPATIALLLVLTVPGTVYMLQYAQAHTRPKAGRATFIKPAENDALSYLAHDRRPGGVLARFYLGMLVPPITARQTYVGNCYWSEPDCHRRAQMSERLMRGELAPEQAQAFVLSTGARFVLGGCGASELAGTLGPIISEVRRFSCATVYVIR